jgi:hypothetical protein
MSSVVPEVYRSQILGFGGQAGELEMVRNRLAEVETRRASLQEKLVALAWKEHPDSDLESEVDWYADMQAQAAGIARALEANDVKAEALQRNIRELELSAVSEAWVRLRDEVERDDASLREEIGKALWHFLARVAVLQEKCMLAGFARQAMEELQGQKDPRGAPLPAGDKARALVWQALLATGFYEEHREVIQMQNGDGKSVNGAWQPAVLRRKQG